MPRLFLSSNRGWQRPGRGGAIDRAVVIDSAEVELLKADLSRG
eukprot:COSAG01_NODE_23219_length_823_cov_1.901934_1_plen_42_part_10